MFVLLEVSQAIPRFLENFKMNEATSGSIDDSGSGINENDSSDSGNISNTEENSPVKQHDNPTKQVATASKTSLFLQQQISKSNDAFQQIKDYILSQVKGIKISRIYMEIT